MVLRNRTRAAFIIVVLGVAMLAAACGGADSSDEPAGGAETAAAADDQTATEEAADGQADAAEPTTVRMQLSWIPDCQFAGYLMADQQGFYEAENLQVELLPGGPNVNAVQQVVSGAADLTVNKVAALFAARDQGLPLVAVAQFDERSSFPLVAYADTGVEGPEDLAGKEVGIWYDGDEYEVLALLAQFEIDPESDLTLFEQGFTMDPFLNREYDVAMVTSFNELNVLYLEGVSPDELTVINPSDYDITIPHGSLMANEDWLGGNREAATGFVGATIEGWNYAFDNPEETASVCAESSLAAGGEAATAQLEELQTRMVASMEELRSEDNYGMIDPELYANVAEIVETYGLIDQPADVDASYDPGIWEAATGS